MPPGRGLQEPEPKNWPLPVIVPVMLAEPVPIMLLRCSAMTVAEPKNVPVTLRQAMPTPAT